MAVGNRRWFDDCRALDYVFSCHKNRRGIPDPFHDGYGGFYDSPVGTLVLPKKNGGL